MSINQGGYWKGAKNLKAPFPWFGGKSRVSHLVWAAFGNVPNYVEPFFGSGAVLLGRPYPQKTETVNDADCYLSNFWRALACDPDQVAHFADWPVNEIDLQARHRYLIAQTDFRDKMRTDPDYFNAKIAGWWVWGLCAWIGHGWCRSDSVQLPHLRSESVQLPHLGNAGRGINRKLPHLGNAGQGNGALREYFKKLSDRLRNVRVCCGDWSRCLGESVTIKHAVTGVFLDPPYAADHSVKYGMNSGDISGAVREWALSNGDNPLYRIALCGYAKEHEMPSSWHKIAWKASGGFGSQGNGRGRENSKKERIWFSPHCGKQMNLFTPESE